MYTKYLPLWAVVGAAFLCVSSAEAGKAEFGFRVVLGDSVSETHAGQAIGVAVSRLIKAGIPVRPTAVYRVKDDGPERTIENWENKSLLRYWEKEQVGLTLVVLGPLDSVYWAGWSNRTFCSPYSGLALVFADDEDVLKTAVAVGHELAHIFGAGHCVRAGCEKSIMSPTVGTLCGYDEVDYDRAAIRAMRRCRRSVKGWR